MFIRRDIPLPDQIVQTGHACLEAGRAFEWNDHTHMVLLSLKDEDHLGETLDRLESHQVRYRAFYEPDNGLGYTSICTEPINGEGRFLFKKYDLWR